MYKQSNAFKGLAICLVILNHTIVMGTLGLGKIQIQLSAQFKTGLSLLSAFGLYAVPLFLFFSGCYLGYALDKRNFQGSYKIVFHYVLNVFWPYLIWSCVFYLLIFLDGGSTYSILGYIKNILIGYPFNFVPIFIFFCLISPFLKKAVGPYIIAILGLFLVYQIFLIMLSDHDFPRTLPESYNVFAVPVLREPLRLWALFFPLGFYIKSLLSLSEPKKKVLKTILMVITIAIIIINMVAILAVVNLPWMKYLFPIPFVLLSIFWPRDKIPFLKFFERLGRRSYGLYLINLIALDLLVLLFIPVLKMVPILMPIYFILLFAIVAGIPVYLMEWSEKKVNNRIYHLLFG
jgi:hypothetical protein